MRQRAASYEEMKALVESGVMGKDVAAKFGVHPTTVSRALRVLANPKPPPMPKPPKPRRVIPEWRREQMRARGLVRNRAYRARMTDEQVVIARLKAAARWRMKRYGESGNG